LTKYLKPEYFSLYTHEDDNELLKKYKMTRDEKGKIKVYLQFVFEEFNNARNVHPLLVYAELINSHDNRNIETAKMIYEEYLDPLFKE
jgi:hypothetical protein